LTTSQESQPGWLDKTYEDDEVPQTN
jgi:hypothetical protein